jgi:hypothetical protein
MIWPKALVTELVSRRCIVFLGSGASAGCESLDGTKRPPDWNNFLNNLMNSITDRANNEPIIRSLLTKEKYLEAAEIILELIPKADYSRYIISELETPRYIPSSIHSSVLSIDPKIVITTNYDKIYDNYCTNGSAEEGYNVAKYYEDHLASDLRSPRRIIIKAHGCVSDIGKIILTKSQYFSARQKYSNFYKILDALFIANTILFVGYSLNDPDIQLVLENANIAAPADHPHYFVTGNNLNPIIKKANSNSYNLEFIEYETGNYTELQEGLKELALEVEQTREINPSV